MILFKKIDEVLVVIGGTIRNHEKVSVEWMCGRAYASVYGYRGELLPGGAVAGAPCYWNEWKPASDRMHEFYNRRA